MSSRAIEKLLWGIAVAVSMAGAVSVLADRPVVMRTHTSTTTAAGPRPQGFDAQALAKAASTIPASNPFRLERQPARVAYGAEAPAEAPSSPPTPDRPVLSVSGIIGGPHWEAILEGVPGKEGGVLVHAGQVIGDLRIRAIGADTVVVTGPDTTWILTLKQPWQ